MLDNKLINDILSTHTLQLGCNDADSILDVLYCCYSQHDMPDPPDIRKLYSKLDLQLSELSPSKNDLAIDTVCRLCQTYEKRAFNEGLLTGFHLSHALFQENKQSANSNL